LVLFSDQTNHWLKVGGDVRTIVRPSDPLEAELVSIRTELSQLKAQEASRDVLIDVLHLKIEQQSLSESEADEVHHMLADETRLRQKNRRRREKLEARRLEIQQSKRGSDT
jgi:pyruvate/oxaloacetate carboxyltransferase